MRQHQDSELTAWMYETLRLASLALLLVRSPMTPEKLLIKTSKGNTTITVDLGTLVGNHFYGDYLSPR
jgi:hypothetical protein